MNAQRKFIRLLDEVPSFGPEADTAISNYIFHAGCWVQGIMCWDFETGRFWGTKALTFSAMEWVKLLPKVKTSRFGSQSRLFFVSDLISFIAATKIVGICFLR